MDAVRITGITSSGDGVGRLADGRAVFIPRTAPGDLVQPGDVQLHARFARARIGALLEPGPDRVDPACRHYTVDLCGGCQLQHLSLPAQRAAKRELVEETLRRIGKLDVTVPPVIAGGEWGYRTRFTLTVGDTGAVGFHRLGQPGQVFPLLSCAIASPQANALWAALRGVALPAGTERITVRAGEGVPPAVVLHALTLPSTPELRALREALGRAGATAAVWWQREHGPLVLLDGPATQAPGFSQVQPALGDAIREYAVAELRPEAGVLAWDLYAGAGQAGLLMAQAGARVESVELDAAAVASAGEAAPHPGIVRHVGRVEQVIHRLSRPTLVYANPPRTGMGPEVVGAIVKAAPARLVYVSCDPATLARDLRAMADHYRVGSIQAWDLFPQTSHVETVTCLEAA